MGGETFESYENHPQHLDVCPKLLLDVRPKIVYTVCLACVKPEYIGKEGGGQTYKWRKRRRTDSV